jgi:hypothetical protein
MVKFQQWDGKGFKPLTPVHGRRPRARAQDGRGGRRQVRAEKKITPRDCSKEG